MSAEQRKPTPKEKSGNRKRELVLPSPLELALGRPREYEEWRFALAMPSPLVFLKGQETLVYLGEIPHAVDLAFNLVVLQQFKTDKNGVRSEHWKYVGFAGYPMKKAIREGTFEKAYEKLVPKPEIKKYGKAKLYDAILADVKKDRGY